MWLLGIERRIASIDNHLLSKIFLTNPIKIRSYQTDTHIVRENIKIVNSGLNINIKNFWPEIITDKDDEKKLRIFLRKKDQRFYCD